MRKLLVLLLILSACTNRSLEKREMTVLSDEFKESGIELLDHFQRTVTGGVEREDGKHTSTNYHIILKKEENIVIDDVYLFGKKENFESFAHEGSFYIIVKFYPHAVDKIEGATIESESVADIYYNRDGVYNVLSIDEFPIKEAVKGN